MSALRPAWVVEEVFVKPALTGAGCDVAVRTGAHATSDPAKAPSHSEGSRLVLGRPWERLTEGAAGGGGRTLQPDSLLDVGRIETLLREHQLPLRHLRTLYTHVFRRGAQAVTEVHTSTPPTSHLPTCT